MPHSIVYKFKSNNSSSTYIKQYIHTYPNFKIIENIFNQYDGYNSVASKDSKDLKKLSVLLDWIREDGYRSYVFESLDLFELLEEFKDVTLEKFYIVVEMPRVAPTIEPVLLDEETWRSRNEF